MAQPKRRDTAARVLAVENLTAKVLRQSVDQVAKRAGASHMAPNYAALVIQATATLAITKAHEAARAKAADVFEAQTGIEAADDVGEDRERAQRAAGGLAKAFRENLTEHLAAGLGATAAYSAAMRDLRPNIERTATTEVMAAWNGETRRQARAARTEVTQTWNAELDACDACAGFGGMTIRADEVFPDGDPPLHPRCRCYVDSKAVRVPEESETRIKVAEPVRKESAIVAAERRANELGAANADYPGTPGRDLTYHRGAYQGATNAEVQAIATGKMAAMNSGKFLPPITLVVEDDAIIMRDGGHRARSAARQAGATDIRATIITYNARGKKLTRETVVSIRGRQ